MVRYTDKICDKKDLDERQTSSPSRDELVADHNPVSWYIRKQEYRPHIMDGYLPVGKAREEINFRTKVTAVLTETSCQALRRIHAMEEPGDKDSSSRVGNTYRLSDCGNTDNRYGAVQKPKGSIGGGAPIDPHNRTNRYHNEGECFSSIVNERPSKLVGVDSPAAFDTNQLSDERPASQIKCGFSHECVAVGLTDETRTPQSSSDKRLLVVRDLKTALEMNALSGLDGTRQSDLRPSANQLNESLTVIQYKNRCPFLLSAHALTDLGSDAGNDISCRDLSGILPLARDANAVILADDMDTPVGHLSFMEST
ncbi:hypothetical protein CLF_106437 [Clonorchis sinensis]|uniref:Uncharacterized protein n=1 Tax=Clonorchis sinensis TaxID=79923 RepID=H2KRI3_CLOSI|nr:hypothetical protein CLF_106437 [Clonorchis sinensis]